MEKKGKRRGERKCFMVFFILFFLCFASASIEEESSSEAIQSNSTPPRQPRQRKTKSPRTDVACGKKKEKKRKEKKKTRKTREKSKGRENWSRLRAWNRSAPLGRRFSLHSCPRGSISSRSLRSLARASPPPRSRFEISPSRPPTTNGNRLAEVGSSLSEHGIDLPSVYFVHLVCNNGIFLELLAPESVVPSVGFSSSRVLI